MSSSGLGSVKQAAAKRRQPGNWDGWGQQIIFCDVFFLFVQSQPAGFHESCLQERCCTKNPFRDGRPHNRKVRLDVPSHYMWQTLCSRTKRVCLNRPASLLDRRIWLYSTHGVVINYQSCKTWIKKFYCELPFFQRFRAASPEDYLGRFVQRMDMSRTSAMARPRYRKKHNMLDNF